VFTTGEMENNDRRKNSKGGEQGRDEIKSSTEPSDRWQEHQHGFGLVVGATVEILCNPLL